MKSLTDGGKPVVRGLEIVIAAVLKGALLGLTVAFLVAFVYYLIRFALESGFLIAGVVGLAAGIFLYKSHSMITATRKPFGRDEKNS